MIHDGYTARRTAADSRPARPFIRPNDGPGDLTIRARLADEARARVERKRYSIDKPQTAAERAREVREEHKREILAFVAKSEFGADQRNMSELLGFQYSLVRTLVDELECAGLVETAISGRVGRGQSITVTATDAGLDAAEAAS
ncbi:hypothetical protein [Caulobacter segnis]|uniref:Uncharacterized protein n=1 Tax=Caulobacter segnis TaxID=88688 RepID=A0A2W5VM75_9CAUL|nr:hypothetical protein [Caulobacter segnis]PZR36475.1 MAG: hypothetical protein DI526_03290 [Caulobacter segnis]